MGITLLTSNGETKKCNDAFSWFREKVYCIFISVTDKRKDKQKKEKKFIYRCLKERGKVLR